MTTALRTGVAVLLIAGILSACNDAEPPAAGPRATASAPSTPSESPPPTGEPPGASPSETPDFSDEDRVLRVAVAEPATLDPMRITDPAAVLIARQLFEGLTRWDPARQQVVPAAAARWKVSDGGRKFTFRLRDGMTFHDGKRVTAADFQFAFNRIAKRNNASDLAYTLERVRGFTRVNQIGNATKMRGIQAPDDRRLVITLTEPFYEFPAVLTHPGLVPVQSKAVKDLDRFLRDPVGNGPFQMEAEWEGSEEVVLEAFPDFFEPPSFDGIRFIPYADAATSWVPFVEGEIDIAEVPVGQVESAADEYGEDGYTPLLAGYYFGFNLKAAEYASDRVRTGVTLAIDREAIARRVFKESMVPPRGIVPRGMPGFDSDLCRRLCTYRPKRAATITRGLTVKEKKITLEYTAGAPHDEVAKFVKRDLKAAGFDVIVKSFPLTKYLKRLRSGDQQFFRLGWIAEFPVPDVFLSSLFAAGEPDNHTGFRSDRVDRLLNRARATRSEQNRTDLYLRAERLILEELPVVPIGTFETHWAVQNGVEGVEFGGDGGFDAAAISLDR